MPIFATTRKGVVNMFVSHLLALVPLFLLFVCSMVWYGRGLVHAMTLGYTICLTFIAIAGSWEILFYPILLGTGLISTILFVWAMAKGGWL